MKIHSVDLQSLHVLLPHFSTLDVSLVTIAYHYVGHQFEKGRGCLLGGMEEVAQ
jgi:hypothetical protein